ncbi:MAG TPA: hypothetical protein VK681_39150 [Reyranella sp.]|nr:hypothetical protein [Reyranella sp.]
MMADPLPIQAMTDLPPELPEGHVGPWQVTEHGVNFPYTVTFRLDSGTVAVRMLDMLNRYHAALSSAESRLTAAEARADESQRITADLSRQIEDCGTRGVGYLHRIEALTAKLTAAEQAAAALTPLARLGLWALKNGLSVPGTRQWYTEGAVAAEAERLGVGAMQGTVTHFDGMPEGVEWFEDSPATVTARLLLSASPSTGKEGV